MVQIDITRMSSKGQVVIPISARAGLKEGDKLVVIRNKDQIILKKEEDFEPNISEDLEFAKRTEAAWKDIDEGRYEEYSVEDFMKSLKE